LVLPAFPDDRPIWPPQTQPAPKVCISQMVKKIAGLHRRVLVGEDVSEEVWNRIEAQPNDR